MILLILIILIIFLLRLTRYSFYFKPTFDYNDKYPEINIDNHYAIYYKNKVSNKCLLISNCNYTNIYNIGSNLINKIKENYDGDIYCYEYQGFGKCKGKLSIKGCVDEHLFWINYLSTKYDNIDLWGYCIGGGVIGQTINKIPINISNKINNIYFHNTFTSLESIIKNKHSILLFLLYKILLLNDFNTYKSLSNKFFKNKKIVFLHSKNDETVPYEEVMMNYNKCVKLEYNTQLITLEGNHLNYIMSIY